MTAGDGAYEIAGQIIAPGKPVRTLDVLDAGDVLPGFKLPVRKIFDDDEDTDGENEG